VLNVLNVLNVLFMFRFYDGMYVCVSVLCCLYPTNACVSVTAGGMQRLTCNYLRRDGLDVVQSISSQLT
jgi:hypothetical protein